MITIDGVTYRNLEEQVRFNQQNINTSATAIAAETERAKAAEAANATNIATNTANITIESDRISAVSSDLAAFETDVANTYLPSATAASTYATIVNFNALDASVVKTSGDQIIHGVKTFDANTQLTNIVFTQSDGTNHPKISGDSANVKIGTGSKILKIGNTGYANTNSYTFPDKDGTVSLVGDIAVTTYDNSNPALAGLKVNTGYAKVAIVGSQSNTGVALTSPTGTAATASGTNSVAIGLGSSATDNSVSIGANSTSSADSCTAIGTNSIASATAATAIGKIAVSSGQYSTSVGPAATATGDFTIAIGYTAKASTGAANIAIGNAASCTSSNVGIAIGNGAGSDGTQTTAIGNAAKAHNNRSVAVGNGCISNYDYSASFGNVAIADAVNSVAIGQNAYNNIQNSATFDAKDSSNIIHMRDPSLLVFRNAEINTNSTANNANIFTAYTGSKSLQDYLDAKQNKLTAGNGIIIDSSNKISADVSASVVSINFDNANTALVGLALNGVNYKLAFPGNATGSNSLAIGYDSTASTPGANAYGISAAVTGNYGIAIGTQCTASGSNALTMGINGIAKNDNDIAIGGNSVAQNGANVALGVGSHAYGNNSISIGDNTFNNISNTVTFDTTGINRKLVVASSDNIIFRNANITNTDTTAKSTVASVYSGCLTLTNLINSSASNTLASAKSYTDNKTYPVFIQDTYSGKDWTSSIRTSVGTMYLYRCPNIVIPGNTISFDVGINNVWYYVNLIPISYFPLAFFYDSNIDMSSYTQLRCRYLNYEFIG